MFLKKQDKRLAELCGKLLLGGIDSMTQRELFETVLLFCDRRTDEFTCEKYISRYGTYAEFLTDQPRGDPLGQEVILSGLCRLITETAKLMCADPSASGPQTVSFEKHLSEYCGKDSGERISEICRRLSSMNYDSSAEIFRAAFLDENNRMIWYDDIARGDFGEVYLDFPALLRTAVMKGAKGILVAHNHPDGNLYPSVADVRITERLKIACENIGIRFLDHIIVCFGRYRSVCDPENNSSETAPGRENPGKGTEIYGVGVPGPAYGPDGGYFYDLASELFYGTDGPVSKWDDAGMFEADDEEGPGYWD